MRWKHYKHIQIFLAVFRVHINFLSIVYSKTFFFFFTKKIVLGTCFVKSNQILHYFVQWQQYNSECNMSWILNNKINLLNWTFNSFNVCVNSNLHSLANSSCFVLLNSSFLPHCFFGSCVFLKNRIVPFVWKSNSRVIIVVFLSTTF